jgi:hypothetical protein
MKILPFIQSEDALSPRFNQSISLARRVQLCSLMWRRRCDDESKNYYCENPMRAAAAEAASAGEASAFSLIFIMVARDDSSWMT